MLGCFLSHLITIHVIDLQACIIFVFISFLKDSNCFPKKAVEMICHKLKRNVTIFKFVELIWSHCVSWEILSYSWKKTKVNIDFKIFYPAFLIIKVWNYFLWEQVNIKTAVSDTVQGYNSPGRWSDISF